MKPVTPNEMRERLLEAQRLAKTRLEDSGADRKLSAADICTVYEELYSVRLVLSSTDRSLEKVLTWALDIADRDTFHHLKKLDSFRVRVEIAPGVMRMLPMFIDTSKGQMSTHDVLAGAVRGDPESLDLLDQMRSLYFKKEQEFQEIRRALENFSKACTFGAVYEDEDGVFHIMIEQ